MKKIHDINTSDKNIMITHNYLTSRVDRKILRKLLACHKFSQFSVFIISNFSQGGKLRKSFLIKLRSFFQDFVKPTPTRNAYILSIFPFSICHKLFSFRVNYGTLENKQLKSGETSQEVGFSFFFM